MRSSSLLPALSSISLSISLTLGSTVALAAPEAEPPPPETPEGDTDTDTGVSEAEKDKASQLSEEAITKFQAKDYDGAVSLFEEAYEIDPQPNYLFNIGRVHEEAGNLESAVEFYAKFVKQPGVDLDSREVALDRLKVLRAILEETEEKQPAEQTPPEETPPEDPEDEVTPPPAVDEDAQRKRKTLRGAGFGVLGVGAAALIGGAVTGALAQSDNNNAAEAATPAEGQDLLESSQTKALVADIMFGVGGALVLTGVVLVAVGYSKPKTQRVAVTPSFGPRGAGVDLRLRF